MEPIQRSRTVTRYIWTMRILGVVYILGALTFFFRPNETLYIINIAPAVFKLSEAIPEPSEHFWLVLSTAMMTMLAALSFLAAESPYIRGYTLVHILSKVVSTLGFLYFFFYQKPYFAYLVGIMTDGTLAILVTWSLIRLGRAPQKPLPTPAKI